MKKTLLTLLGLTACVALAPEITQAGLTQYLLISPIGIERKLTDAELFQFFNQIPPINSFHLYPNDSVQVAQEDKSKKGKILDQNYPISSRFHELRPQGGSGTRYHEGVDIATPKNTPIYSPWSGVVVYSGWKGRYGRMIEIETQDRLRIRFAHLLKRNVNVGDDVKPGQEIALSGNSGYSTGPHTHVEVRENGIPINPLDYSIVP
jgi:murein DD-endopeptidase MepM/ murein hydrolase activator NlpD